MKQTPRNPADRSQSEMSVARSRARAEERIQNLLDGDDPKKLMDDTRLRAALFISGLYAKAKKVRSLADIQEHCGAVAGGDERFRIHRWMLKRSEKKITPELLEAYAGQATPSRKVRTYLRLVAALAELTGGDTFKLQHEFVTQTGLIAKPSMDLKLDPSEVQPELRLANLLRDHAAQMADRYDLTRLFQRAERLQAGWDLHVGPVAKPLGVWLSHQRFDARLPPEFARWFEVAVPPYPAVKIARIPYGQMDGNFSIVPAEEVGTTASARMPLTLSGSATAYWDLHLAIAPQGSLSIGSFLIRGTSVDIILPLGPDGAEIKKTLRGTDDDLWSLVPLSGNLNLLDHDGLWQVHLTEARAAEIQSDEAFWRARYRPARQGGILDEDPPGGDLPEARIAPVTAQSVRDWLVEDLTLPARLGGAEVEQVVIDAFGDPGVATWCQGSSLARGVEAALHDGTLDTAFKDWIDCYNASLNQLEENWFDEALRTEYVLRDRWKEHRLAPGADEGGEL